MYQDQPQPILCQGDIVADYPYPTLYDLEFRKRDFIGQLRVRLGPLMLISHDCDMELYANVPKRVAIQLCPLGPIPKQILSDPAAFERLKTNQVVPEQPEFINLFYCHPSRGVIDEQMVVDLSVIHSLPCSPKLLEHLLTLKKLELQSDQRGLLQDKLMYHFGRTVPPKAQPTPAPTATPSPSPQHPGKLPDVF